MFSPNPPYTPLDKLEKSLLEGFAVISAEDFELYSKHSKIEWEQLKLLWENLPPDEYLRDGGKYRQRRHSSIIVRDHEIEIAPHRPHWQPVSYNALHGGILRHFQPCEKNFLSNSAFQNLVTELGQTFSNVKNLDPKNNPWFIEVHQFRIDTKHGIGRPTPEGAHRDGVDFVAIILVDTHEIKGGESRVFLNNQPLGLRFTLKSSWNMVLLDDEKVIHETTPIQPNNPDKPENSWRDTLVLTYRLGNFQDQKDEPQSAKS